MVQAQKSPAPLERPGHDRKGTSDMAHTTALARPEAYVGTETALRSLQDATQALADTVNGFPLPEHVTSAVADVVDATWAWNQARAS